MALTQCDKIMRHIEEYGSITTMEAVMEYGIMRLASRVTELKAQGIPIVAEIVPGRNRYGEKIYYAKYKIKEN